MVVDEFESDMHQYQHFLYQFLLRRLHLDLFNSGIYFLWNFDQYLPSFKMPKSILSGKSSQPRLAFNGRLLRAAAPIDALFGRTITGSSISRN